LAFLLRKRYISATLSAVLLILQLIQWPLGPFGEFITRFSNPLIWSALLLSAAIGADWLANLLSERDLITLPSGKTSKALLAILLIFLGSLQLSRLSQLYQLRPLALWQLQTEIGSWLRSDAPVAAKLLATEKMGYLAQRQTVAIGQLDNIDNGNSMQEFLQDLRPDYLITDQSVPWQNLTSSSWFQLTYQPLRKFEASNVAGAPYTVWTYRPAPGELEPRQTTNARVPDRLRILGYQIGPGAAQPGETIEMVLYLEAPEATIEPSDTFKAIIRLVSPLVNSIQAFWEITLPQSKPPNQWQPGEVIVEEFALPLPDDMAVGAYNFNVSFLGPDSDELWPISLDNDMNRLDRMPLGNIVVPWQGSLAGVQKREASFGDQIQLVGYLIENDKSDTTVTVTLYWQTNQQIDMNYTVFVHLIDEAGNLITSHDSLPANGLFPTTTWREGMIIPDRHTINIPLELPNGEYQIRLGMYLSETGERLPVIEGTGELTSADSLTLETISTP